VPAPKTAWDAGKFTDGRGFRARGMLYCSPWKLLILREKKLANGRFFLFAAFIIQPIYIADGE
jgi:hypothetical protein